MEIVTSWMEEGIEKGVGQGRYEEASIFIFKQLTRRFGPLTESLDTQLKKLTLPQLERLAEFAAGPKVNQRLLLNT